MAQNANTSTGTIATEGSGALLTYDLYKIVAPRNGTSPFIALQYSSGNFLVLQSDGTWIKRSLSDLSSNNSVVSLQCASHTHTIKGTFK